MLCSIELEGGERAWLGLGGWWEEGGGEKGGGGGGQCVQVRVGVYVSERVNGLRAGGWASRQGKRETNGWDGKVVAGLGSMVLGVVSDVSLFEILATSSQRC